MKKRLFIVSLIAITLNSCSSLWTNYCTTQKLYKGDILPDKEVAFLFQYNDSEWSDEDMYDVSVIEVDGVFIEGTRVALLPGLHTVEVELTARETVRKNSAILNEIRIDMESDEPVKFRYLFEAGHDYQVDADLDRDNRIWRPKMVDITKYGRDKDAVIEYLPE